MNSFFKELLFKLDILAPALVLLVIWFRGALATKEGSFTNRILVLYLVLQMLLNALAGYLQYRMTSNLWVYHLNCQLTQVLFTLYFLVEIQRKSIVWAGFLTFSITDIVLLATVQPYDAFPSYPYALSSFILVIYALICLNAVIDKIPTFHILSLKEFWLITGVLTYFGSAFLIFISYHYLSEVSPKNVYILWQFHNVFIALSCVTFAKAITSKQWIRPS